MSTPIDQMIDELSAEDATPLDATPEDVTAPAVEGEKSAAPEPDSTTPEQVERARDAITGRFTPQPPPTMPDPVKAAETADQGQKVLPLAAHLEERRRWQAEMRALEERLAKIEHPPEPPKPEPDFLEDPKGYVDAKTQKALDALQKVEQKIEPVQQQAQVQQFLQVVGSVEAEYVKQAPDYYDAIAHVRALRAEQLSLVYPQATREQIAQALQQEELQFAAQALQAQRNPSELAYQMAQRVYGYRPRTEAPAAAKPQAQAQAQTPSPAGQPTATLGPSGAAPDVADLDEMGTNDGDDLRATLDVALRERFQRR